MKISELKQQIDIADVVGVFTELIPRGNKLQARENPIREEKTSSFFVYRDTQKWFDFGSGEGGDVIDFIENIMNLDKAGAISFLQEKYHHGHDEFRPLPQVKPRPTKKDNNSLLAQLEIRAQKYLSGPPRWGYFELEIEEVEGQIRIEEVIRVAPVFGKLFEGSIIPTDRKFASYLFGKVVGYDKYYDCPVIILRDESEIVVDIVRYRPKMNGEEMSMKYLYLRNGEKPDSSYLFPLQAQMQKIMRHEKYCFVGEGLKNAINASLMGIPFISIEGAGTIRPGLINFLKSDRMKNIIMIGAFDGDEAGERAYKRMNDQIPMVNKFAFDSGEDFTDFLRGWR